MSFLGRRLKPPPPEPKEDPLNAVRTWAQALNRDMRNRDAAIRAARMEGLSHRVIAEAAQLSRSRAQQIAESHGMTSRLLRSPVMELETSRFDGVDSDFDVDEGDRVVGLESLDPWLDQWPSEREFLAQDQRRLDGNRYDFAFDLYDLNPEQRWVLVYIDRTREVYTFPADLPDGVEHDGQGYRGSLGGPCKVLGSAPSYQVLDAALSAAIGNVQHRLGGLAWVYTRLKLLNSILKGSD